MKEYEKFERIGVEPHRSYYLTYILVEVGSIWACLSMVN